MLLIVALLGAALLVIVLLLGLRVLTWMDERKHCARASELMRQVKSGEIQTRWRGCRVLLLVNPFGGAGRARRLVQRAVLPVLDAAGVQFDVVQTTHRGHAREVCANLEGGKYAMLVVASGDGMFGEVLNGFADRVQRSDPLAPWSEEELRELRAELQALPLSLLPTGTSNGIASSMLSNDLIDSLRMILAGEPKPMDVLAVHQPSNGMTSFDGLSFSWGIIGVHDHLQERVLRWMPPAVRNLAAPLLAIAQCPSWVGKLSVLPAVPSDAPGADYYVDAGELFADSGDGDGWLTATREVVLCSVFNQSRGSATDIVSPALTHDSGTVDLMVCPRMSRFQLVKVLLGFEDGSAVHHPGVSIVSIKALRLDPLKAGGHMNCSGEVVATVPSEAKVLPGLVSFVM